MKKVFLLPLFFIALAPSFSQNIFDYYHPELETGIMPGMDLHLRNLSTDSQTDLSFIVSPNAAVYYNIFTFFGITGELGARLITTPEFEINPYIDVQPSVFFDIGDHAKINLLLGSKTILGKDFSLLNENITFSFCISGRSDMGFDYFVGVEDYMEIDKPNDILQNEINPYMLFIVDGRMKFGLKYNLISSESPVGSMDDAKGDILKWLSPSFEYLLDDKSFGLELKFRPINISDEEICLKPFGRLKLGDLSLYADLDFSILPGGYFSFGSSIRAKYMVKRL